MNGIRECGQVASLTIYLNCSVTSPGLDSHASFGPPRPRQSEYIVHYQPGRNSPSDPAFSCAPVRLLLTRHIHPAVIT